MPYDPPTGKELAALQKVMLAVRKLDQLRYGKPYTANMTIDAGHALDGVRCNGWGRLNSVLTVRNDIRRFRKESAIARAAAEKNDKVAEMELLKVERILTGFHKCPDCNGECGKVREKRDGDHAAGIYSDYDRWHSCKTCNGRGLVIK